jgi:hypothetical protein
MSFVLCDMNSITNHQNGNFFLKFKNKLTLKGFKFDFLGFGNTIAGINSFCKFFL